MKWKNEIPNKFEFMKINSYDFIQNEKLHTELEHEKNLKFLQTRQCEEIPTKQDIYGKNTESGITKKLSFKYLYCKRIFINENLLKMSKTVEKRLKYIPAKIKRSQADNNLLIQRLDKDVKVRMMSDTITLTQSKTDFTGSAPKRYRTTCFIKPTTTPYWYTESLFLTIGSTKRTYTEQIHFKNRLYPFYWAENMLTEVKTNPKCIMSELEIPIDESEYHYLSLIPQQKPSETTSL